MEAAADDAGRDVMMEVFDDGGKERPGVDLQAGGSFDCKRIGAEVGAWIAAGLECDRGLRLIADGEALTGERGYGVEETTATGGEGRVGSGVEHLLDELDGGPRESCEQRGWKMVAPVVSEGLP